MTVAKLKEICLKVERLKAPEVPWFPLKLEHFDNIGKRILGAGDGI